LPSPNFLYFYFTTFWLDLQLNFEKNVKNGGFRREINSENRHETVIRRSDSARKVKIGGKISFYFYIFESMKKARNPLWDRAFCRFPTDYAFLSFIATMISPKSVFSSFVG